MVKKKQKKKQTNPFPKPNMTTSDVLFSSFQFTFIRKQRNVNTIHILEAGIG